jgi:diguanylate cyclase (GGDEF)-like protein/PAS domain S-box-containing protein
MVKRGGVSAAAAIAAAAGLHAVSLTPWLPGSGVTPLDFATVIAATALVVLLEPVSGSDDRTRLRLSFAAELCALVLLGPSAMSIVAVVAVGSRALSPPLRVPGLKGLALDLAAAVSATQGAGVAFAAVGLIPAAGEWPWRGVAVAAAVAAYCFVASAIADVIAPLASGTKPSATWPRAAFRTFPTHVVGGSVAIAVVAIVEHRAWGLLILCAVPIGFAWDALRRHVEQPGTGDIRPASVLASSDHGLCLVDRDGIVVAWNDLLAASFECPRDRAVGLPLEQIPGVAHAAVTAAAREALATGSARTLRRVAVRTTGRVALFDVTLVPESHGLVLLWTDVTPEFAAEKALRDAGDRFALIAQGANDGLWELDEGTRALFISPRWREILGLPAGSAHVSAEEWFSRVHPDDAAGLREVLAALSSGAVERAEHEHRIRHEDGTYRRILCRCVASRDARRRVTRFAGSMTDITESAIAREQIQNAGSRDPLTNLLNRMSFVERLNHRLDDYKARRAGRFAALHLDLDRFKVVNDGLGHQVGDELLLAAARRLEGCLRPGDAVARLGGDEFAVLLQNISDETQANVVAFRLQEALQAPFTIHGREVVTSASIGIAISRAECADAEEMMRDADTAMYQAKARGKARHELYDAEMHARRSDRLGLESDLRRAVKSSSFEVHYQPIVSLESRMTIGFESLVRWNRHGKPVSPADFIPMAEELGIIEPLGTRVMRQACEKFDEWKARCPQTPLDCITVNVSAKQLVQQGFIYLVEQTVEENGMTPGDLRLEITETALMDAPQQVAKILTELREFGVKIYLDDFGTGYSSLSHLHKLPVDALKIDRSFVRGLLLDDRPAIVESILALARTLHTSVVAEGIEEEQQAAALERLGCRRAQGFYFSRPIPVDRVEALLAAGKPLGGARVAAPQPLRASLLKPVPARDIA